MKRWRVWLAAVLLSCIPILMGRITGPGLLQDTDTRVLLITIRQHNSPFSWFVRDWPLQNHFYRPISTLFFELDNKLYGAQPWGYGLTNDLLAIGCVLLLFWFLVELTSSAPIAGLASILFATWHVGLQDLLYPLVMPLAGIVALVGLLRHGRKLSVWIPGVLLILFVGDALVPLGTAGAVLGWIPARTAEVMTLFALISMASYARYERLTSTRRVAGPSPLDPPATRSSRQKLGAEVRQIRIAPMLAGGSGQVVGPDKVYLELIPRSTKAPWVWIVLSAIALALALGSYEQAVMLPALLLGVAVTMRITGYRVNWRIQGVFWALLFVYLGFRYRVVPSAPSQYQLQQFRHGPGVWSDLAAYVLPMAGFVPGFLATVEVGWLALFDPKLWVALMTAANNVAAILKAKLHWQLALSGYLMSILAFLPMAWLKRFEHYHYLPMALRSLFVVTMGWVAWDLVINALSPPTTQAPQRPSPAPGSLPRP